MRPVRSSAGELRQLIFERRNARPELREFAFERGDSISNVLTGNICWLRALWRIKLSSRSFGR